MNILILNALNTKEYLFESFNLHLISDYFQFFEILFWELEFFYCNAYKGKMFAIWAIPEFYLERPSWICVKRLRRIERREKNMKWSTKYKSRIFIFILIKIFTEWTLYNICFLRHDVLKWIWDKHVSELEALANF